MRIRSRCYLFSHNFPEYICFEADFAWRSSWIELLKKESQREGSSLKMEKSTLYNLYYTEKCLLRYNYGGVWEKLKENWLVLMSLLAIITDRIIMQFCCTYTEIFVPLMESFLFSCTGGGTRFLHSNIC